MTTGSGSCRWRRPAASFMTPTACCWRRTVPSTAWKSCRKRPRIWRRPPTTSSPCWSCRREPRRSSWPRWNVSAASSRWRCTRSWPSIRSPSSRSTSTTTRAPASRPTSSATTRLAIPSPMPSAMWPRSTPATWNASKRKRSSPTMPPPRTSASRGWRSTTRTICTGWPAIRKSRSITAAGWCAPSSSSRRIPARTSTSTSTSGCNSRPSSCWEASGGPSSWWTLPPVPSSPWSRARAMTPTCSWPASPAPTTRRCSTIRPVPW